MKIENIILIIVLIVGSLIGIDFWIPDINLYSLIGIAIFEFIGFLFIFQLGRSVPIRALMLLIAILQWVIAPIAAYHFYPDSQFYYMIVDENTYMSFVVPSILLFTLGLYIGSGSEKAKFATIFSNAQKIKGYDKRGMILIGIGFTASLVLPFLPSSLRYLFLLLSYMKIIGAFYIYLSNKPLKWIWIIIAFSGEVISAFDGAMFHDMILWAGYLFILYSFLQKIKLLQKLIIIATILFAVVIIQYIKADYREIVWNESSLHNSNKLELATDLAANTIESSNLFEEEDKVQNLVDRINQGWIIARILNMVPHFEPYADGETIMTGIEGALLPRFLSPNKVQSGGKENFTRFTGVIIDDETSMDLSILGEAYANYGYYGTIFFMFILGVFYNSIFRLIIKYGKKHPELIVWIPFVFFYTVKAENDFATALNQLVKSIVLLVGVIYALNKVIPLKKVQDNTEKI